MKQKGKFCPLTSLFLSPLEDIRDAFCDAGGAFVRRCSCACFATACDMDMPVFTSVALGHCSSASSPLTCPEEPRGPTADWRSGRKV